MAALPVGEVIRRYEEEYGRDETAAEEPAPAPARVDLNQTSFLLSPPEWLQEAADRLGIPDRRGETSGVRRGRPRPPVPVLVRVPCRGRRVRRTRAGRRRPRVRAGVPARPGPRSRPRVPVRRLPLPLPTAAGRRGRRRRRRCGRGHAVGRYGHHGGRRRGPPLGAAAADRVRAAGEGAEGGRPGDSRGADDADVGRQPVAADGGRAGGPDGVLRDASASDPGGCSRHPGSGCPRAAAASGRCAGRR